MIFWLFKSYIIIFFHISECQNYRSLNSYTRRITYSAGTGHCDRGIGPDWFRFEGSAGTRMPTSCPRKNRCGTNELSWLKGGHPTVADGQVKRQVCFHFGSNCCAWSKKIKVRNCGSYYVYFLHGTPYGVCNARYCGTNWKQGASKVIHDAIKKRKKKRLQYLNFYHNLSKRRKKLRSTI